MQTKTTAVLLARVLALAPAAKAGPGAPVLLADRLPVILDTDIGDDIDDTWALVALLRSPELDLKLVTTTFGKAVYRAEIAAGILTIAGRTDVPIGLGGGGREGTGGQAAWAGKMPLAAYKGRIHQDGVKALIDLVRSSPRPLTIISIGPSTTLAEALARDPGIADKAFFVGMQGSVHKGYDGGPVSPEWNVKGDVPAAQRALSAPWKRTLITPLDTCGLVRLKGGRFASLARSADLLVAALMENYRLWAKKAALADLAESSVLFDTVAVFLALPSRPDFLSFEDLPIAVDDQGFTRVDPSGRRMSAATAWKDLDGYADWLIRRLQGRA